MNVLVRMPAPLVLRDYLAHGTTPTLHRAGADRVMAMACEHAFAWPGVDRFGALVLLDAARFQPLPHVVRSPTQLAFPCFQILNLPLFDADFVYVASPTSLSLVESFCRDTPTATSDAVMAEMPESYNEERRWALARIDAYVDQLNEQREAYERWCKQPASKRAARLAHFELRSEDVDAPLYTLDHDIAVRVGRLLEGDLNE